MMIFICMETDERKKAITVIPKEKVDLIKMFDNEIRVFYRTGTYDTFDEETQNFAPVERQANVILSYNSQDDAMQAMRDFYAACQKNVGAFTFKKYNEKDYVTVNDLDK